MTNGSQRQGMEQEIKSSSHLDDVLDYKFMLKAPIKVVHETIPFIWLWVLAMVFCF
jgi:hypothetical protein